VGLAVHLYASFPGVAHGVLQFLGPREEGAFDVRGGGLDAHARAGRRAEGIRGAAER